MGSLHWPEIILIILLVVLIFGAKKIPEIGKGIGEGIRNFRKSMKGNAEDTSEKNGPKGEEKK